MRASKSEIRDILRKEKDAMTSAERLEKSRRICRTTLDQIRPGETVMVYSSKEKEVNTGPLIDALLQRGNPVVVPIIVSEDVSLRLSYLRNIAALVPSTFGVPEPIGSEIPATGDAVDTIILPMLGFDRTGGRIGYGAGYYDRFLAKNRHLRRIGIAFARQEFEGLPLDENDVRMDVIITEEGIVYPTGGMTDGDQRDRDT